MHWMASRRHALASVSAVALLTVALLSGCVGEPAVPLDVPARQPGQALFDEAGILDADNASLVAALEALQAQGWDVALVTFESVDANLGMADRAGRKVIDAWGVDLALVAVAAPGDFASTSSTRRRYFGLTARTIRSVSPSLRERIAEELVPRLAAKNQWTQAFTLALTELAQAERPATEATS